MKPQLSILLQLFFFLTTFLNAQTKIIQGDLYDKQTNMPIEGAKIIRTDTLLFATSLKSGKFAIVLPADYSSQLIITHPNYEPFALDIKPYMELQEINIGLVSTNTKSKDISRNVPSFSPTSYKNNLSLAPVELLFSTITVSYERFLAKKQSVGLMTSVYINRGGNIFFYNNGSYVGNHLLNGFQAIPFYRYYFTNADHTGPFIQAKFMAGYFDVTDTYDSPYDQDPGGYFWTGGAGIAFGVKINHRKFPRNTLEFTMGVKYMPITNSYVERVFYNEVPTPGGGEISTWYIASPGAIFDVKFIVGGLF